MARINQYAKIVQELLKDYERPKQVTETNIIMDTQRHHYQVLRMGWNDTNDILQLHISLYLHIKPDGKIWILANWTEDDIETTLLEKGKVHEELDGFEIKIDAFGEITSSFSIDKINTFLNKNVDDRKMDERNGKFGTNEEKE